MNPDNDYKVAKSIAGRTINYAEAIKYLDMRREDQIRNASRAKSLADERRYQAKAQAFAEVATFLTRMKVREPLASGNDGTVASV